MFIPEKLVELPSTPRETHKVSYGTFFWFLITNHFVFSSSSQPSQFEWRMITYHLMGQSKWCQTKQRSTQGRFLKSTRSPQSTRCVWLFHCARWFSCQLWGLLSRVISWRWSMPFTWDTRKGISFFICLQWVGRDEE
jgi:hypothetical protein